MVYHECVVSLCAWCLWCEYVGGICVRGVCVVRECVWCGISVW